MGCPEDDLMYCDAGSVPVGTGDINGEDCEGWWEGLRICAGMLEGGTMLRTRGELLEGTVDAFVEPE